MVNVVDVRKDSYHSILNLLGEFPDIITFSHLRYVLVDDNYKNSNSPQEKLKIARIKNDFNDPKYRKLINSDRGRVKQNCITSAANLRKYLRKLKKPPIDMIYKDKQGIYHLSDYGILRQENKDVLDFFPPQQIKKIDAEGHLQTHLLYGISEELYNKFKLEEKEDIKKNLDTIDRCFRKIQDIKETNIKCILNQITKELKETINNKKIKQLPKEKNIIISGCIWNVIDLNQWRGIDICSSKTLFFNAFGIRKGGYIESGMVIRSEIYNFPLNTEKDVNKFCIVWSETFFRKDYQLTMGDIHEIIEWAWKNRDTFKMLIPFEIAYSRFGIIEPINFTN